MSRADCAMFRSTASRRKSTRAVSCSRRSGRSTASGLSREEDIDRRLMIGLLESTIHTAEARRMWENDASLYVPAGEIGRALEPTAPGTPQERAADLTRLLDRCPRAWSRARKNLVKPPRSYTESAIFKTEGTIKVLRASAPGLAKEAGEPASR